MSKPMPPSENNIDQIRSLIFGPQMQEYQQRFDQLSAEIADLRKEMRDAVAKMHTALDNLNQSEKKARERLGAEVREMETRFQKMLTEAEERLRSFISEVDGSSAKRVQLADYLMEVSKQLRQEDSVNTGNGEVATPKDG